MSLQSVSVSPAERRRAREFAELLEGSRPVAGHELAPLVTLTTTLLPTQFVPRDVFRAALRESLVAEAAARSPVAVLARSPADTKPRRHRARTIVVSGVLASLIGGIGAAAASTHAVPGDPLYGLKRGIESAQLRFAHSDLARGRDLLDQANQRLSEAETLAASQDARTPTTEARIAQTLTDLDAASRAGATALEAAYADTGDVEPLLELHRFVVDQQQRLADLSGLLSPDQRALVTPLGQLLATLQAHLDALTGTAAKAAGSGQSPGGSGVPGPLGGVTGRASATPPGGAGSAGSPGGGAASLPAAVPHVSVPAPPLPGVHVPTPSATPTLPALPEVSVPPVCVPVPPLTDC